MLDINPVLLVSTIIVFLILIAVLNSWLYNPLFKHMDDRDAFLKKELEEVGSNQGEIAALLAKADQIIADAKRDAAELRDKVIADAKELAESKLEAKRAELASEYVEFQQTLVSERENLNNALLSQVPLFKEAVKAKFSQI